MDVGNCIWCPRSVGLDCDTRTRVTQLEIFQKECEEERCNKYFSLYEACAKNTFIHPSRTLPAMLACAIEEMHGEVGKRISGHDALKLQNSWPKSKVHFPATPQTVIDSPGRIRSC